MNSSQTCHKQLNVTFKVQKIFQFDPRYLVMKSNKDENEPLKIEFAAICLH